MPVSEATAAKAVAAWELDGSSRTAACGCTYWVPSGPDDGRDAIRQVSQCQAHRPAWLPQVIANADR